VTVKELFSKLFSFISGIFWLGTVATLVWQLWFTFGQGMWELLTISSLTSIFPMNFQPSAFYSMLIYGIVTKLPLILAVGLLAVFTGKIAEKLE
jgi:hypothetical protein